jgi:hypothetical protein
MLPVLTVAVAALLEIAHRETDPVTLLNRRCSLAVVKRHLLSLMPEIAKRIQETMPLEPSKSEGRPTHEFDWHLEIPMREDDPLNQLATLGLLAVQNNDLYAFARVIRRSLEIIDWAESFALTKSELGDRKVREVFRAQTFSAFHRVILAVTRDKETVGLAHVAIDTLAEFVVTKTMRQEQTHDAVFSVLRLMERLAEHCYESGSTNEIRVPLILARQIVQKGMDAPLKPKDGKEDSVEVLEFYHQLPYLSYTIKRLGTFAIAKSDSNLLYRCLDAFSWLGCSALKRKDATAIQCLRALCQLGREARAKGLECHWDRCALRPEDHAAERIDWIATWLLKLPEDDRDFWLQYINCAYSRLFGKRTSAHVEVGNNRVFVRREVSDKNYIESYTDEAAGRQVDFSDFTFLKDLELERMMDEGTVSMRMTFPLVFGDSPSTSSSQSAAP